MNQFCHSERFVERELLFFGAKMRTEYESLSRDLKQVDPDRDSDCLHIALLEFPTAICGFIKIIQSFLGFAKEFLLNDPKFFKLDRFQRFITLILPNIIFVSDQDRFFGSVGPFTPITSIRE